MNPEITILMPTYNMENSLQIAVDSVLKQKGDVAWELLILDDASNDETPKIAQKLVKKHKNIKYIRNEKNLKIGGNTIKAYEYLQKLETPYFSVLDPDDYWEYNKMLLDSITFLKKHKNYTIWGTNTKLKLNNGIMKPYFSGLNSACDYGFLELISFRGYWPHTSSAIFANVFFNTKINFIETIKSKAMQEPFNERCFAGDSFRNILSASAFDFNAKIHIEPIFGGVYNITQIGDYTANGELTNKLDNAFWWALMWEFFDRKFTQMLQNSISQYNEIIKNPLSSLGKDNAQITKSFDSYIKITNLFNNLKKDGVLNF